MEKLAIDLMEDERFKPSPLAPSSQRQISKNTYYQAFVPNLIAFVPPPDIFTFTILLLLRTLEISRLTQFIPSWRTPEHKRQKL